METVSFGALIETKAEEKEERALEALEAAVANLTSTMKDLRRATDRFGAHMSTAVSKTEQLRSSCTALSSSMVELRKSLHSIEQTTSRLVNSSIPVASPTMASHCHVPLPTIPSFTSSRPPQLPISAPTATEQIRHCRTTYVDRLPSPTVHPSGSSTSSSITASTPDHSLPTAMTRSSSIRATCQRTFTKISPSVSHFEKQFVEPPWRLYLATFSSPSVIPSTSPPPVLPVTPIVSYRHSSQPAILPTVCAVQSHLPQLTICASTFANLPQAAITSSNASVQSLAARLASAVSTTTQARHGHTDLFPPLNQIHLQQPRADPTELSPTTGNISNVSTTEPIQTSITEIVHPLSQGDPTRPETPIISDMSTKPTEIRPSLNHIEHPGPSANPPMLHVPSLIMIYVHHIPPSLLVFTKFANIIGSCSPNLTGVVLGGAALYAYNCASVGANSPTVDSIMDVGVRDLNASCHDTLSLDFRAKPLGQIGKAGVIEQHHPGWQVHVRDWNKRQAKPIIPGSKIFDDTSWTYLVVLAAVLDNRNAQFYNAHGCFHSQQSLLELGSSYNHCYTQMAMTHPTKKSGTACSHIPKQASMCFNHSFLPISAHILCWNCCEALSVFTRRILDSLLDFSTREFQAHTAIIAAALNEIGGLDEITIYGKASPARGSMTSPKIKCKMLQENSTKTVDVTRNHAQGSLSNMDNGGLYGKKLKLDATCDVHDLANHIPSRCMKNSKRSLDGNHDNGEFSCRQSHVPCKASRAECGQNACVDEAKGDTEGCLRLRSLGDFPSDRANDTSNGISEDLHSAQRMEVAELANVTKGKSSKAIQMESGKAVAIDDAITRAEMEVETKSENGFVHIENQLASLANIDSLLPKITCGLLELTLCCASIVYCCSSLQPKALITRLVKDGTRRTTLVVGDGGSVYDIWPSCASNQAAQGLLLLPFSFSQMGMLSGLLFQVFYGLVGSWTAYIISVHYIEYCNRREREGASFKNHVIQWFEVLAVLLGPYWKGIGLASNCILLLLGTVIQLIAYASNIYSINDRLDKRTWAHNFGACCATIVFIPSFHNYRIGSFLGLGMTIYTALYLTIVAFVHGQVQGVTHSGPTKREPYFTGATNILYTFGGHAVIRAFMHGMWKPQKFKCIYLLATLHLINLEDKVVLMETAMLRTRCYRLDQSKSYGVDGVTNYKEELPDYPATPEIAELYPGWIWSY